MGEDVKEQLNVCKMADKKSKTIDTMISQSILNDPVSLQMLSKSEKPLETVIQRLELEINDFQETLVDLILKNKELFFKMLDQKTEVCEKIKDLISKSSALSEISINYKKNLKIIQEDNEKVKELQASMKLKKDLEETVLKLKSIESLIDKAENFMAQGDLFDVFNLVEKAKNECSNISNKEEITVLTSCKERLTNLKSSLIEKVNDIWDCFIIFGDKCVIKKHLKNSFQKNISLTSFVKLSLELKIFDSRMLMISNKFVSNFLLPLLNREDSYILEWNESDDEYNLIIKSDISKKDESIFPSLLVLVNFIDKAFPSEVLFDLTKYLFSKIQSVLVKDYINSIDSYEIKDLDKFNKILLEGSKFNDEIKRTVWDNQLEIEKWIKQASEAWVLKQKSSIINSVRKVLNSENSGNVVVRYIQNTENSKMTQNIEGTKIVQNNDSDFTDNDWGENWDNEDKKTLNDDVTVENDTWGLDDNVIDNRSEDNTLKDELWNWDDNDDWNLDTENSDNTKNSENNEKRSSVSMVSIDESYTISFLPKEIILIIENCIKNMKKLMSSQYTDYIMAPFFPQLSGLITMALSAYRALTPLYYDKLSTSAMLLYNDFIYISIHLQELYDGSEILQCILDESNIFRDAGNLVYFSELQMQNNDIMLILEQTNGFVDCTDKQQIEKCTCAIYDLYEKFQMLSKLWRGILSREMLFESIGQLLDVVVVYIITSIKNIPDISEEESKQLSKLCNEFVQVENIFVIEKQEFPVTPTYVPNWLKFRYLIEILEASMQDVMYLYNSGALIDFEKEEIISLLKTLFAETPSRAENISKIRNS